jgi:hypothetical protein
MHGAAHEQLPGLQRRQFATIASVVDQAQCGAHSAATIAARISEPSTAVYRSVMTIDACPSADIPPNAAG